MRGVLFVLLLFIIPFVSSEYYNFSTCGQQNIPVLNNNVVLPEYCIEDADCTLELIKTINGVGSSVSSLSLQSGYGEGLHFNNPPYFYFNVSGCMNSLGVQIPCTLPYDWGIIPSRAIFTIPGGTYNGGGKVHVEHISICQIEENLYGQEVIGYKWNHLNTLNNLDATLLDGVCYPGLPCDIEITLIDSNRDFIGDLTVRGRQGVNSVNFVPSSITSRNSDSFVLTVPANTFVGGYVELYIYDLTNKIPFNQQEGGVVSIDYSNSLPNVLGIDVSPNECLINAPCDVAIHVNRAVDSSNQVMYYNNSAGQGIDDIRLLPSEGVTISGTTIYYTLLPFQTPGPVTVGLFDSTDSSFDEEIIMMINPSPSLICGDSLIQNPNDDGVYEQCDSSNLNDQTCALQGFDSGALSCNIPSSINECRFNTSLCTGVYSDCGDHSITGSEDCDFDSDGDPMFPAGINDCDDVHSGWTGELGCDSDCDYDGCSDPDTTSPGNTNTPPIVGPDQYLLNSDCVEDSVLNDEFGVLTWTVYNQFGQATPQSGITKCVLESEKIPFFGIYSMLIFVLVLVGFYGFRKKQ